MRVARKLNVKVYIVRVDLSLVDGRDFSGLNSGTEAVARPGHGRTTIKHVRATTNVEISMFWEWTQFVK